MRYMIHKSDAEQSSDKKFQKTKQELGRERSDGLPEELKPR